MRGSIEVEVVLEADTHEFVLLDYHGIQVEIDNGLVGLMKILWEMGIHTNFSCQNNLGKAYIMFDGGIDADMFCAAIATAFGDRSAMYQYMNSEGYEPWSWEPATYKGLVRWAVRFPPHHIAELEEVLGKWLYLGIAQFNE